MWLFKMAPWPLTWKTRLSSPPPPVLLFWYMWVHEYRVQESTSRVLSSVPSTLLFFIYSLRQSLTTACQASQWAPETPISAWPALGLQVCSSVPGFSYPGFWKPSLHTTRAEHTFPPEIPLQPLLLSSWHTYREDTLAWKQAISYHAEQFVYHGEITFGHLKRAM